MMEHEAAMKKEQDKGNIVDAQHGENMKMAWRDLKERFSEDTEERVAFALILTFDPAQITKHPLRSWIPILARYGIQIVLIFVLTCMYL